MGGSVSGMVINNFEKPVTYSVRNLHLILKEKSQINQMKANAQIAVPGENGGKDNINLKNQTNQKYESQYNTGCVLVQSNHKSQIGLINVHKQNFFSLWVGTVTQKERILIQSCQINKQVNNIRIQIDIYGNCHTIPYAMYEQKTDLLKSIKQTKLCKKNHKFIPVQIQPQVINNQSSSAAIQFKFDQKNAKCGKCTKYGTMKKWKSCLYSIYSSGFFTILLLILTCGLYYLCSCYSYKKKPRIQMYGCQCPEIICEQCYDNL